MIRERGFLLHLHCANCQRPSTKTLAVPCVEGAPGTVDEFIEQMTARPVPFFCRHCESLIGDLVGVTMEKEMRQTETTFFAVITFRKQGRRLVADQPRSARNAEHARSMAERLSSGCAGVLAFSRSGDPDTGDFDDAAVLVRYGDVPEEIGEAAAA
jgi:hypothetical protein